MTMTITILLQRPITMLLINQAEDGDIDECLASSVHQLRNQFFLFVRLFVVLGITWITEFVHVLIHSDHRGMEDCNYYFEVTCIVIKVYDIIWFMKSDRCDKNQFL